MQSKKIMLVLTSAFIAVTILSACGAAAPTEDPSLQITQIAGTIQAGLTQAAALTPSATATLAATATATIAPPTETPSGPTNTPTLTPYPTSDPSQTLNNSHFVADVTVPDGSDFAKNEPFVKTWRFKNTGKTTWSIFYSLKYVEGPLMGANGLLTINLPHEVKPGETVDISMNFISPGELGTYTSYWKLYTDQGVPFGETCSITIDVTPTGHM